MTDTSKVRRNLNNDIIFNYETMQFSDDFEPEAVPILMKCMGGSLPLEGFAIKGIPTGMLQIICDVCLEHKMSPKDFEQCKDIYLKDVRINISDYPINAYEFYKLVHTIWQSPLQFKWALFLKLKNIDILASPEYDVSKFTPHVCELLYLIKACGEEAPVEDFVKSGYDVTKLEIKLLAAVSAYDRMICSNPKLREFMLNDLTRL